MCNDTDTKKVKAHFSEGYCQGRKRMFMQSALNCLIFLLDSITGPRNWNWLKLQVKVKKAQLRGRFGTLKCLIKALERNEVTSGALA